MAGPMVNPHAIYREILELLGHNVALGGFLNGYARFEHFLGLGRDVVEHFAQDGNTFLPADLAVAGNENRVLIVCRKFRQVSRASRK